MKTWNSSFSHWEWGGTAHFSTLSRSFWNKVLCFNSLTALSNFSSELAEGTLFSLLHFVNKNIKQYWPQFQYLKNTVGHQMACVLPLWAQQSQQLSNFPCYQLIQDIQLHFDCKKVIKDHMFSYSQDKQRSFLVHSSHCGRQLTCIW